MENRSPFSLPPEAAGTPDVQSTSIEPATPTYRAQLELANLDKKIDQQAQLEGLYNYDREIERAKQLTERYKKTRSWIRAHWDAARETGFARTKSSIVPFWSRGKKVEQDRRLIQEGTIFLNNDIVSQAAIEATDYENPDTALAVTNGQAVDNPAARRAIDSDEIAAYRQRSAMQGQELTGLEDEAKAELDQQLDLAQKAIEDYARGVATQADLGQVRDQFLTYFRQNFADSYEVGQVMADNIMEIAEGAAAFYQQNEDQVGDKSFVDLSAVRLGAMTAEPAKPVSRLKGMVNQVMSTKAGEVISNPLVWEAALWSAKHIPFVGGATAGGLRKGLSETNAIRQVDQEMMHGYQRTETRGTDRHRQEIMETFSKRYQATELVGMLQYTIQAVESPDMTPANLDKLSQSLACAKVLYEAHQDGNHRINFDKGMSERQHLQLLQDISRAELLAQAHGLTAQVEELKQLANQERIDPDMQTQRKRQARYVTKKALRSAAISGTVSLATLGLANGGAVVDAIGDRIDDLPVGAAVVAAGEVAGVVQDKLAPATNFVQDLPRQAVQHLQPAANQVRQSSQDYWNSVRSSLYTEAAAAGIDEAPVVIEQAPSINHDANVEIAPHVSAEQHDGSLDINQTYGTDWQSEYNELGLDIVAQPDGNLLIDTSSMMPDANGDGLIELPQGAPRFAIFRMDDGQIYKIPLDDQGQIIINPSAQPELFTFGADGGSVEFNFDRLSIATENSDGSFTYHASVGGDYLEANLPDTENLYPDHQPAIQPSQGTTTPTTTPETTPEAPASPTTTPESTQVPPSQSTATSTPPATATATTEATATPTTEATSQPTATSTPEGGSDFSPGPQNELEVPNEPAQSDGWRYIPTANPFMNSDLGPARANRPNAIRTHPVENQPSSPQASEPVPSPAPESLAWVAPILPGSAPESAPAPTSTAEAAPIPAVNELPSGPEIALPATLAELRSQTRVAELESKLAAQAVELEAMRQELSRAADQIKQGNDLMKQLIEQVSNQAATNEAQPAGPSRSIRAENAFKAKGKRTEANRNLVNPAFIPDRFMQRAEQDATPANKRGIRNYAYTQARRILGVSAEDPAWKEAMPRLQQSLDQLFQEWDNLDQDTRRRRLRQLANGTILRANAQVRNNQEAANTSPAPAEATPSAAPEPAEPAEPTELSDDEQLDQVVSQEDIANIAARTNRMNYDQLRGFLANGYDDQLNEAQLDKLFERVIAEQEKN